jgi:hypothetical protein
VATVISIWLCYFSEEGSSLRRRHSLLLRRHTCTGNNGSSGIPERTSCQQP